MRIIFLIVIFFIFLNCSGEKSIIIDNIDYKKAIIGKWEAYELGNIMKQFNYSLPSRLEFIDEKNYYYLYTRFGIREERWGKYELIYRINPVEIAFYQKKPNQAQMNGIIRFIDNQTFQIVFYYENIMSRVYEFKEKEYQIYKKVQGFEHQN